MNLSIFLRVCICILTLGFFLFAYINKQNGITKLRIDIPNVSKEVELILQENVRLQYEIDQFENPLHLNELARRPEFAHLRYPIVDEILTIPKGDAQKK